MSRGNLRIYLGAAPGVGKTYAMLQEARRRAERGADIVIGAVETHGRRFTDEQIGDLDVIPRKKITYRGTTMEEMDVDAILKRAPEVCLVDEMAHTNVPGSRNPKRHEDIELLLGAGIDVISTVNIQHLESLRDVVERITGITQREVIPDAIVRRANQVHLVDQTPEALRRRMLHGNIYDPERADVALANYFRVGNLTALRELALMWVADQVDEGLQAYRERHGIAEGWETRERIVVAITGAPSSDDVIRRAARIAGRLRGELIGVRVRTIDGLTGEGHNLATQRSLLSALGGRYREVASGDVARALVNVARAENATQIVLGSSRRSRWQELTKGSIVNDVARHSGSIDVHIISTFPPGDPSGSDSPAEETLDPGTQSRRTNPRSDLAAHRLAARRGPALSVRRRSVAWVLAFVLPVVLTAVLRALGDQLGFPSDLLVFLSGSVVVATVGGLAPALVSALLASLALNWFFTQPLGTMTISQPENVLALFVFLVVAGVVGVLVSRASKRSAEAARARSDAESLAAMAALTSTTDDPMPTMIAQVRTALGADGAAVLVQSSGTWEVLTSDGRVPDSGIDPESAAAITAPVDTSTVVALYGEGFDSSDIGVLGAFSSQLTTVLNQQRLRREAASADQLAEVNQLRTSLLAAVSHDLRTPLAVIKASASSLRQSDIEWAPEVQEELLETIEDQTDRLTELVSNLLGMSRIQSGAVRLYLKEVSVDEVVNSAIGGVNRRGVEIVVRIGEELPPWYVDPSLAERVVANLLDNAVKWSPEGGRVEVTARRSPLSVVVSVADHGPGIAPERRREVFEPFQRLGDGTVGGTGLGLAVAKGLTEILGGDLLITDTDGGGTTVELSLASSPHPEVDASDQILEPIPEELP